MACSTRFSRFVRTARRSCPRPSLFAEPRTSTCARALRHPRQFGASEVQSSASRPYSRTVTRHKSESAVIEQWLVHGSGHGWSGGSQMVLTQTPAVPTPHAKCCEQLPSARTDSVRNVRSALGARNLEPEREVKDYRVAPSLRSLRCPHASLATWVRGHAYSAAPADTVRTKRS
jgi:hypothetical protein